MTSIIRVVPSGCQIEDSSTSSIPHMLNFATINELRCSEPKDGQFSITYQGSNLPYVFPPYSQITEFIKVDNTSLGAPGSSTQLYSWLKEFVFDVYAGGSGGGGGVAQNVNITAVNGDSPADLATETTLNEVLVGIGTPTDTPLNDPGENGSLIAVNKGYWNYIYQILPSWFGTNISQPLFAPTDTGSLASAIRGFWQDFITRWKTGNGTQADALRVTLSNDGQFVNSIGNTTATQATTDLVAGQEITAQGVAIALLKLIAAKIKGQVGNRFIAAVTNGTPVVLPLGGQTYKDFGLQIIAATPSNVSAVTIVVEASANANTSTGNYDSVKTITIPTGTQQRVYDILSSCPARTLRFTCTGGSTNSTINIFVACY